MSAPPLSDDHPCHLSGLDAPVSPATAHEVLLLCGEVLLMALRVIRQAQASRASAKVIHHLSEAQTHIEQAQWWQHRNAKEDAP